MKRFRGSRRWEDIYKRALVFFALLLACGAALGEPPSAVRSGQLASEPLTWREFLATHELRVKRGYRLVDIAVDKTFVEFD